MLDVYQSSDISAKEPLIRLTNELSPWISKLYSQLHEYVYGEKNRKKIKAFDQLNRLSNP